MNEQDEILNENQIENTDSELDALAEELRLKNIEKVRALPLQKILTFRQQETLLSIKKEELTDEDRQRISLSALRLKHHRYTGTDYTPKQKKKLKAKRKLVKKSRRANR